MPGVGRVLAAADVVADDVQPQTLVAVEEQIGVGVAHRLRAADPVREPAERRAEALPHRSALRRVDDRRPGGGVRGCGARPGDRRDRARERRRAREGEKPSPSIVMGTSSYLWCSCRGARWASPRHGCPRQHHSGERSMAAQPSPARRTPRWSGASDGGHPRPQTTRRPRVPGATSPERQNPRSALADSGVLMAVPVGFEPTVGLPTQLFESCTFGRSDTVPRTSYARLPESRQSAREPRPSAGVRPAPRRQAGSGRRKASTRSHSETGDRWPRPGTTFLRRESGRRAAYHSPCWRPTVASSPP